MGVLAAGVDLFELGQSVRTAFGRGVVSAVSRIDSLVYVTLTNCSGLYVFRPEQVEAEEKSEQTPE
jgi:hypothetical protein